MYSIELIDYTNNNNRLKHILSLFVAALYNNRTPQNYLRDGCYDMVADITIDRFLFYTLKIH